MADVFISYSRRDGEFARRLVDGLEERGKDVWVDVEGIRDAEVFPAVLQAAVEQSDGFVFVISPDSVASVYCEQEVEHALELNKRIVPLLLDRVPDEAVPVGIRVRNWIPFGDDAAFETALERVIEALDTDLDWAREHTGWLVKSLEWDTERREKSFLLRGSELAAAEAWLGRASGKEPEPTALQREYVAASRLGASRRQRTLLAVAGAVAAGSLGLLVFALISRNQAIGARNTARSQALAAESETQTAVDPERSILLAVAALRQGSTPEATFALRGALDASPIRLRLPDAGPQTCGGQQLAAPGVAFSPNGRLLAEGLCGGVVVLADAKTGRIVRRIHVGSDPFGGAVAFSSDGRVLAACCRNGIVVLDAATGRIRAVGPRLNNGQIVVAFDPKAPVLAVAQVGRLVFWNYATGERRSFTYRGRPDAVSFAFSPDGRRLAVAINGGPGSPGLALVDVRTGQVLKTVDGAASAVAFSPDGRRLAVDDWTVPNYVGRVVLRDAATLKLRRVLVQVTAVQSTALAFSPDGMRLAYGYADGTAGLVSVQTGQQLASYLGQTAAIVGVAFSPDGRLVATGSADGTTRIWRASGEEQRLIAPGETLDAIADSASGLSAILERPAGRGSALVVQTWRGPTEATGTPLQISPTANVDAEFLSADGRYAGIVPIIGNGATAPIRIWSVAERRLVRTIPRAPSPVGGEPTFSPDDMLLAMGVPPAPVRVAVRRGSGPPPLRPALALVDLRTGKRRILGSTACGAGWRSQPFSADGKLVAGGSFCGQVQVWDVATGKRVGRPFSIGGELAQIAFNPAATQLAVASWNGTVTIADVATGKIVAQLTGDTSGVTGVAYSPDGRYLATVSLDHAVRLYDAHSLRQLRVRDDPDALNDGLAFAPDSHAIVTVDSQNVIRVWDACTDCESPKALIALARQRVTRTLTAQEVRTFGVG
jgi:WD40 repeat protein